MEANDAEGSRMQKANDEPRLFPRSFIRLSVSETDCRRVRGSSILLEGSYVSEARTELERQSVRRGALEVGANL